MQWSLSNVVFLIFSILTYAFGVRVKLDAIGGTSVASRGSLSQYINQPPRWVTPSRSPRVARSRLPSATLNVTDCNRLAEEADDVAKKLFDMIDKNSDGQISRYEMKTAFIKKKFGTNKRLWNKLKLKTFRCCMEFVETADIDGDGKVSFEEFRAFLTQIDEANFGQTMDTQLKEEASILNDDALYEMLFMFESVDRDRDGQITEQELKNSRKARRALNLNRNMDIVRFVQNADTDGDGVVNFDEFKVHVASSFREEFNRYVDLMSDDVLNNGGFHAPREKNAQVVIFREVDGELQVLVQLRSNSSFMPGHLGLVGGRREVTDADSRVTAIREVAEETGLVDIMSLGDTPEWLQHSVEEQNIPSPRRPPFFFKFREGLNTDWWALQLNGPGVFTAAPDQSCCADMTPMLDLLPADVQAATCFGHAWVPVRSLKEIPDCIPRMAGDSFSFIILRAAVQLRRLVKYVTQLNETRRVTQLNETRRVMAGS